MSIFGTLSYICIRFNSLVTLAINSVEKIQRRAARYVTNDYNPYSSVTQL